jgi:hypothetical protein
MTGFGEDSVPPGLLTYYEGIDTATGGSSVYYIEKGSNGNSSLVTIQAGDNTNGVGFVEIEAYLSVPSNALAETVTFAISVNYEYTT